MLVGPLWVGHLGVRMDPLGVGGSFGCVKVTYCT